MANISSTEPPRPADSAEATGRSLPEVHGTVRVTGAGGWLRRFLAFAGPGYLVSVGYMDPGNWATDLAGGAKFGYALLWVILLSNLMAMFLQTLCVRLGIAGGRDLAQACRDQYPKPVAYVLWILCEIAIIACDLAEVVGSAVALYLLFGIPLVWGVVITGFDVMLLLAAMHFGFRKIEAIVITLVTTVAACFVIEVFLSKPEWGALVTGLVFARFARPTARLLFSEVSCCSTINASLRKMEAISGPFPFRRREASSAKITSSTQCKLFSMPQWPRIRAAIFSLWAAGW